MFSLRKFMRFFPFDDIVAGVPLFIPNRAAEGHTTFIQYFLSENTTDMYVPTRFGSTVQLRSAWTHAYTTSHSLEGVVLVEVSGENACA